MPEKLWKWIFVSLMTLVLINGIFLTIKQGYDVYNTVSTQPAKAKEWENYAEDLELQSREIQRQIDSLNDVVYKEKMELLADSLNKSTEMPIKYPY